MAIRVMIMAGGTGGHVFPALAVAQCLKEKGCDVSWLGTKAGLESRVVPEAGFELDLLSVSGLRGKGLLSLLKAPFMLIKACSQASAMIKRRQPNVVIGFGGFASGPGGLMAWWHKKPLVIHEQNRVPGTTNKLLKTKASRVLEAFPNSFDSAVGAECVGNPVRKALLDKTALNHKVGRNVFVMGGSLGAAALNEIVPKALALVQQQAPIFVIHQAGERTVDVARRQYEAVSLDADVRTFIEDMADMYSWADVIICRAGAMTISELAVFGVPSVLVPLPNAIDDHQTKNAQYLSENDAALLIPQAELSAESLASVINEMLKNTERLKAMRQNAKALAKPDATEQVAKICMEEAA